MSEVEKQINELVNTSGKQAPVMSSALKSIGEGSMQDGIKKMADYYHNSGCVAGTQNGIIIGEKRGLVEGVFISLLCAAIGFGVKYIYDDIKMKKAIRQLDEENEKEGKEILKELRNYVPDQAEDEKKQKRVILSKIKRFEDLSDQHSDDINIGHQSNLAE